MPTYIRYEVKNPSGRTTGIFTADFSLTTLLDNTGVGNSSDSYLNPKYERVFEAWKKKFSWINDPEIPGEYWFKPEGDRVFRRFTLPILSMALPDGSEIVRVEIEANDTPIYDDYHQACFNVKQDDSFRLTNML